MERPFAHQFGTGGWSRLFVRSHLNFRKRLLIHVCGFNLGLLIHHLTGTSRPRSLQARVWSGPFTLVWVRIGRWIGWDRLGERCWASIRPDSLLRAPGIRHLTISTSAFEENTNA